MVHQSFVVHLLFIFPSLCYKPLLCRDGTRVFSGVMDQHISVFVLKVGILHLLHHFKALKNEKWLGHVIA
jgi:hypothetical protein